MTIFFVLSLVFLGIFVVLSLVFLGIFVVSINIAAIADNNIPWIIAFVFCLILSLAFAVAWQETTPPEVLYKEKLEAVEKAERDLQKFLIDYPQFKE
jgi:protein-S-isoprenylcysteine O-methyltransferase Ste14